MNIVLNSNVSKVKFNGNEVDKVKFNGVQVWQKVSKQWQTISTDLGYYYYAVTNVIRNTANTGHYGTRISVVPGEQYRIILKGDRTSIDYNPSSTAVIKYYFKQQTSSQIKNMLMSTVTETYDSSSNTTTLEFTAPEDSVYIVWSITRSNATSSNTTEKTFNSTWDHAEQYM